MPEPTSPSEPVEPTLPPATTSGRWTVVRNGAPSQPSAHGRTVEFSLPAKPAEPAEPPAEDPPEDEQPQDDWRAYEQPAERPTGAWENSAQPTVEQALAQEDGTWGNAGPRNDQSDDQATVELRRIDPSELPAEEDPEPGTEDAQAEPEPPTPADEPEPDEAKEPEPPASEQPVAEEPTPEPRRANWWDADPPDATAPAPSDDPLAPAQPEKYTQPEAPAQPGGPAGAGGPGQAVPGGAGAFAEPAEEGAFGEAELGEFAERGAFAEPGQEGDGAAAVTVETPIDWRPRGKHALPPEAQPEEEIDDGPVEPKHLRREDRATRPDISIPPYATAGQAEADAMWAPAGEATVEAPVEQVPEQMPAPEYQVAGQQVAEPQAPEQMPAPEYQVAEPQVAGPQAPEQYVPEWAPEAPVAPVAEPKKRRRGRAAAIVAAVLAVVLGAGVAFQLVRPLPEPTMRQTLAAGHTFAGQPPAMPWPGRGQAQVVVDGIGTMGAQGQPTPVPTASVAKVMTAYVFLKNHPLPSGEAGPVFTIGPGEAAKLPLRRKRGESRVEVKLGQRFTERRALEALMVVSANDIAHELARWDAGNEAAFVAKMNATARELGMTNTRYTDPSGYDARTVSTAADQVKLLTAAMRIPAFAEVAGKRTYEPVDGTPPRPSSNVLLGVNGVVAGKTGYTDAAGGNFVFAARKRVAGVNTLIVGAVMGQAGGTAGGAINVARNLTAAAQGALTGVTLARQNQPVAEVDDGLGGVTPLVAGREITAIGWAGLTVRVGVSGRPPGQAGAGQSVGTLTVGDGPGEIRYPLSAPQGLQEPDLVTRLTRVG